MGYRLVDPMLPGQWQCTPDYTGHLAQWGLQKEMTVVTVDHVDRLRSLGGFPKRGYPIGWFIRENHIKMDDLGVPPFMETPI